jgi:hypothetical protein
MEQRLLYVGIVLLGAAFIFLPLWAYDRFYLITWDGNTELEVAITVIDATSTTPIPGARIEVQSWGTMGPGTGPGEDEETRFDLFTDAAGVARKECGTTHCSGQVSGLRFTDTFHVYRPWWMFRVSADGYEPSELVDLHFSGRIGTEKRTGGGRSTLFLQIVLQRQP